MINFKFLLKVTRPKTYLTLTIFKTKKQTQ